MFARKNAPKLISKQLKYMPKINTKETKPKQSQLSQNC